VSVAAAAPDELLAANFDHGPGPFTVTTAGDNPLVSLDVRDDTYRIRLLSEKSYPNGTYAHLARAVRAVAVSVDVVEVSSPTTGDGDLVGVACSDNNGDGYFLQASEEYYFISKLAAGRFADVGLGRSPIPGSGKVERLRLTCVGAKESGPTNLWASINGTAVPMVKDPQGIGSFTTVALRVAADQGTEARFDNVLARVPEPEDF
jgi:hypothetical protein